MNKKVLLLPLFILSLGLAGCKGKNKGTEPEPAPKPIWEEALTEGESSFAQVKETAPDTYVKVRGTVAANSGSTLSLYRGGQFLYCYNFKAGENENLQEHPLGSYVEIYAKVGEYSESKQLAAYFNNAYDSEARLTKLADQGETVVPLIGDKEEDFENGRAAGAMMKVNLVPNYDYELDLADTSNNQNINGKVGEADVELRLEKYLPADVRTAIFAAQDSNKFEMSATYEVTALAAATSGGSCRLMFVDSATWRKTADANFDAPTGVAITSDGNATSVEVGATLQLTGTVAPETAKPIVIWTSEHPEIASVSKTGVVKGLAVGTTKIFAAASANPEIKNEIEIEVKAPAVSAHMVNVPAANTAYKAGVEQLQAGGRYFLNGAMDSYKVATTENLAQAIDVELIPVEGKEGYFHLKCHIGETVKYGKVAANGNNVNFTYENNPETEWSLYELEGKGGQKTIVTNVTGCDNANKNGLSYLGTFGTGTSLTVSRTFYIEGETNAPKIDAATNGQYPLHFYTVS